VATAAGARGWSVHWYDRERVFRDAAAVLDREDIEDFLHTMGRSMGAPWQAKHKLAAAAALAVTGRHAPRGRRWSAVALGENVCEPVRSEGAR
jgi:hypothetical protein